MEILTSPNNKKIKEAALLLRKASRRKELGLFPVEGVKMFLEAPADRIREVYAEVSLLQTAGGPLAEKLKACRACPVSPEVFRKLSDTQTPQGVLALVETGRPRSVEQLLGRTRRFLLLEHLQDPGNLGTILRSAEGAGFAVIADQETADVTSPKVVRSTMGAIFRVPYTAVPDLKEAVLPLKAAGIPVCAAHLQGSISYEEAPLAGPAAIMIGNESAGLRDETAALADLRIRIPMLGSVESLNAAVAASILMYEAARQRRAAGEGADHG